LDRVLTKRQQRINEAVIDVLRGAPDCVHEEFERFGNRIRAKKINKQRIKLDAMLLARLTGEGDYFRNRALRALEDRGHQTLIDTDPAASRGGKQLAYRDSPVAAGIQGARRQGTAGHEARLPSPREPEYPTKLRDAA